jgi:hypothetical protein
MTRDEAKAAIQKRIACYGASAADEWVSLFEELGMINLEEHDDMKDAPDPFKRDQVEAICRAICAVEGIYPDESPFDTDIGSGPNWTRYADAVASVICGEPE